MSRKRPVLSKKHEQADVVGVFKRASGGYGFVHPDGFAAGDRSADVHITAHRQRDAVSGDVVKVRLLSGNSTWRQGPTGEIIEVVSRKTTRFVGRYFESSGISWVRVDGNTFDSPISVGDPGAKDAGENDKVVIEIVRFPQYGQGGEGVVVEVLGALADPGVDAQSIIHEFDLPGPFPDEVLADAREQAAQFSEEVLDDRRDLTEKVIVTIDPTDARDFDDAISLDRIENDHWLLGVHIADVCHFVRKGSPLDIEAARRGTSVYLPGHVIPMLPEIVSNNLASLQPERVRFTRTCWIEFSPEGIPIDTVIERSAIKSHRRFTYDEVDTFLSNPATRKIQMSSAIRSLLGRMRDLARVLRSRRIAKGSLELDMPEVKIDLDRSGRVTGAHVVEHTESHQIIEEFMLAANEAVARTLSSTEGGYLRRVHAAPDLKKLQQLNEFVNELGFDVESLESRFELQKLLQKARGCREEHAIHYAVLRSFKQACYSPQQEGHFALASDFYCHFTSPIRRYPDLTIHRALDTISKGHKPPHDGLHQLGEQCSHLERRAESAERELVKLKLLLFLSSRIGEEMDAVVTGVERFGIFAQGMDLPAEGFLSRQVLPSDRYRYDKVGHVLSGAREGNVFRLGDRLRVSVQQVDLDRRLLEFGLVDKHSRGKKRVRRSTRKVKPRMKKREHHGERHKKRQPRR